MGSSITIKTPEKRELIKQQLREWIRREGLKPGDRLLPQTQLAKLFNTTEVTMHRLLRELTDAGLVYRLRGKGTYVAEASPEQGAGTICLVLPGRNLDRPAGNPLFWSVVQSLIRCFIQSTEEAQPFTIHAVTERDSYAAEAETLEKYAAVFFHYEQRPREFIDFLIQRGRVPVVCLGQAHPQMPCLTIDHDRISGARRCVAHLLSCGYARLGLISSAFAFGQLMVDGFVAGLQEHDQDEGRHRVVRCEETPAGVADAVTQLLADGDCDAILTDNDMRALHIYHVLQGKQVSVPDRVGLMGYDGVDWAIYNPPYLTTLEIPWAGLIQEALREIANRQNPRTPHKHLQMIGTVAQGQTTAHPTR